MLSRIFVSLLILSALTSDGTVNLAEYLFSSGLYVDTGLIAVSEKRNTCICEEKGIKGDKVVKDNSEPSFATAYDSIYIIKAKNNINKFYVDFNYVLNLNIYTGFHSEISFWPLSFNKDKKIVLNSSDLSPPVM